MTRKLGLDIKVRPEDEDDDADARRAVMDEAISCHCVDMPEPCKVSAAAAAAASPEQEATAIQAEEAGVRNSKVDIHDQERGSTSETGSAQQVAYQVSETTQPESVNTGSFSIPRCLSNFSSTSSSDGCRVCQQHAEEPTVELGCHCRGELAKAHPTCIQQWFANKGSNKCEICQEVAENIPAPAIQASPHFWVWRLGVNRQSGALVQGISGRRRFHPLWAALLILIAGLLFDVLISVFLGASALPVNIIIGVLVVLGIGTAARLVAECWHEHRMRRNRRMMEATLVQVDADLSNHVLQQPGFIFQPSGLARAVV